MAIHPLIERNPKVLGGKPVIKGTRISVEQLLEHLGGGWSEVQIHDAYPQLPEGSVKAACSYAARTLSITREILLEEATR